MDIYKNTISNNVSTIRMISNQKKTQSNIIRNLLKTI